MTVPTIIKESKQKELIDLILNSPNPEGYLFGVILTTVGENQRIPMEVKNKMYVKIQEEVKMYMEENIDEKLINFAFTVMSRHMRYMDLTKFSIPEDMKDQVKRSYSRSLEVYPLLEK